MKNVTKSVSLTVTLLCLSIATPNQSHAQNTVISSETVGARINLAGKQEMLAERMAKAFCFMEEGINADQNLETLVKTKNQYEAVHIGFRDGNGDLKLFAEQDQNIKNNWDAIDRKWRIINKLYNDTIDGTIAAEDALLVIDNVTVELRKLNNEMLIALETVYRDNITGDFASTMLFNLYERQLMLSQELSKEICISHFGNKSATEKLKNTIAIFEATTDAFLNGRPDAGIASAPSDEIKAQLEIANKHWNGVSEIAKSVARGEHVNEEQMVEFDSAMDSYLLEIDKAINMLFHFSQSES